jgi:hypothetical protein
MKAKQTWKPGKGLPYVIPCGEASMLAIKLPAVWLKADRSGQPLLLPPAVRALDRLQALFTESQCPTPGFLISLREGLDLTQSEFGRKLGVSKMTVSRWERGKIRPGPENTRAIFALRAAARRNGVKIDGERRHHSTHRSHFAA